VTDAHRDHSLGLPVIVLAAGHGTRMGGPKAFTRHGGQSFLERILERCAESNAEVTLTVDPSFKARLLEALKARPVPRPHLHLRWVDADGRLPMLASVQAALAAGGFEHGFWMWPVDAPFLSADGWRVLSRDVAVDPAKIVKPVSDGKSGHPVWFPAWTVSRIAQGGWPDGLQGFLHEIGPGLVRRVDLPGERINDVDTPEELAAMSATAPLS
jgi:CTP:molybdopterin cytidylyltransferase MocA